MLWNKADKKLERLPTCQRKSVASRQNFGQKSVTKIHEAQAWLSLPSFVAAVVPVHQKPQLQIPSNPSFLHAQRHMTTIIQYIYKVAFQLN